MTLIPFEGGDGLPMEPDWSQTFDDVLDHDAAHVAWSEVVRELSSANVLAIANGPMIERLVNFRVVYARCARDIAARGVLIKAKKSGVEQHNPHWSIMCKASDMITALEVELGIPPVRRGKAAKVTRGKTSKSASENYLAKRA